MKKLAVIGEHPGSINSIKGISKSLNKDPFKSIGIFSKKRKDMIPREEFTKLHFFETSDEIPNIIEYERPNIILTGISAENSAEMLGVKKAKEMSIPTISIMDFWKDYEKCLTFEGKLILPDYICVIDDKMKEDISRRGINSNILITGNPYFHQISEQFNQNFERGRILFASQPIKEDYGNKLGYTQHDSLEILMQSLIENREYYLQIRNHPREIKRDIELPNDESITSVESILKSEIVISMFSTVLLEALILGRKVFRIIPEKGNPKGFPKHLEKYVPLKRNINEVIQYIKKNRNIIQKPNDILKALNIESNPIEKICEIILNTQEKSI